MRLAVNGNTQGINLLEYLMAMLLSLFCLQIPIFYKISSLKKYWKWSLFLAYLIKD